MTDAEIMNEMAMKIIEENKDKTHKEVFALVKDALTEYLANKE